ncbi:MAG: TauD/TfdA family dioxygenase [Pseudomonadota bacterium]
MSTNADILPDIATLSAEAPTGQLSDDLASEFRGLMRERGAVRLRGFTASAEQFLTLSDQFGQDWLPYRHGRRQRVLDPQVKVQLANAGHHAMAPHSELCYLPLQPRLAWFYCEQTGQGAGATTLVDGAALAARFGPELLELFEHRTLRYQRNMSLADACSLYDAPDAAALAQKIRDAGWQDVLCVAGRRLIQDLRVPALPRHPETGQSVFVNQLLFNASLKPWALSIARQLGAVENPRSRVTRLLNRLAAVTRTQAGRGLAATPTLEGVGTVPAWAIRQLDALARALTVRVVWQSGDVLVFDNLRFLHGREAFRGSERRILTRFGAPAWLPAKQTAAQTDRTRLTDQMCQMDRTDRTDRAAGTDNAAVEKA